MVHIYSFLPIFLTVSYGEVSTEQYDMIFAIVNKGISCVGGYQRPTSPSDLGGGGVIIENSLGFHLNWLKIQLKGVGVAIICIWPCSQMSRVVVHGIQRSVSGDLWLLGNNIRPKVAQKSAKVGFWAVYRPSIVYNGDTLSRPSIKL